MTDFDEHSKSVPVGAIIIRVSGVPLPPPALAKRPACARVKEQAGPPPATMSKRSLLIPATAFTEGSRAVDAGIAPHEPHAGHDAVQLIDVETVLFARAWATPCFGSPPRSSAT
jgi:hypothetical protein